MEINKEDFRCKRCIKQIKNFSFDCEKCIEIYKDECDRIDLAKLCCTVCTEYDFNCITCEKNRYDDDEKFWEVYRESEKLTEDVKIERDIETLTNQLVFFDGLELKSMKKKIKRMEKKLKKNL